MSYRDDLHNEMNPDMRSFGSKGVSSINPHDEADKKKAEEEADARDSVDEGEGVESCEENRGPNYEPDPDIDPDTAT